MIRRRFFPSLERRQPPADCVTRAHSRQAIFREFVIVFSKKRKSFEGSIAGTEDLRNMVEKIQDSGIEEQSEMFSGSRYQVVEWIVGHRLQISRAVAGPWVGSYSAFLCVASATPQSRREEIFIDN